MHESFVTLFKETEPHSALACYFIRQNLTTFKMRIPYDPYILILCPPQNEAEVASSVERLGAQVDRVEREDSGSHNHVAGQRLTFLRLTFKNRHFIQDFLKIFQNNRNQRVFQNNLPQILKPGEHIVDPKTVFKYINKVSEHDVSDGNRISIDLKIRCATWYRIQIHQGGKI